MSATDANRFVLRFARFLTGRPKIAVMDWCYHGTVDETLAVLDGDRVVPRPGAMGPQVDVALTTRVVPFNDARRRSTGRSPHGDVAALLMEPALTNIGIVLPEEGYLDAVREITRRHDVLLVIDETHTLCAGPGGATRAWGLDPDLLVVGKPIGGGVPVAAYGMTEAVAARIEPAMRGPRDRRRRGRRHADRQRRWRWPRPARPCRTPCARRTSRSRCRSPSGGPQGSPAVIDEHGLPWHVQRLGCRAEYWFCPPPRNGADAAAAVDDELEGFMHLWALNRGILLTPFHNMALFSPHHTTADVDRHTEVFGGAVDALLGR